MGWLPVEMCRESRFWYNGRRTVLDKKMADVESELDHNVSATEIETSGD